LNVHAAHAPFFKHSKGMGQVLVAPPGLTLPGLIARFARTAHAPTPGVGGLRQDSGELPVNEDPADEQIPKSADARSTDDLFAAVYARLKAMAGRQLARGPRGATLDTTALVHEVYLRLNASRELRFAHDAQFFAYAARAMRHLLCDRARDRMSLSAGGDWQRVTLTGNDEIALDTAEQTLALDTALDRLASTDARAAQVVELRYFAGLTLEQVAELFEMNRRTVDRDWRFARAFLRTEIGQS